MERSIKKYLVTRVDKYDLITPSFHGTVGIVDSEFLRNTHHLSPVYEAHYWPRRSVNPEICDMVSFAFLLLGNFCVFLDCDGWCRELDNFSDRSVDKDSRYQVLRTMKINQKAKDWEQFRGKYFYKHDLCSNLKIIIEWV